MYIYISSSANCLSRGAVEKDLTAILTNEGGDLLLFRVGSFSVSVWMYVCSSLIFFLTVAVGRFWLGPVSALDCHQIGRLNGQNQFEHT